MTKHSKHILSLDNLTFTCNSELVDSFTTAGCLIGPWTSG